MAGILSALGSIINPANVVRGLGSAVTGVLDDLSEGKGLNIFSNLSKGIKTTLGDVPGKSYIGSTGGNYQNSIQENNDNMYPSMSNQASNIRVRQNAMLNSIASPKYAAVNQKPIVIDGYGRGSVYRNESFTPVNGIGQFSTPTEIDNLRAVNSVASAPGGLPSFEIPGAIKGVSKEREKAKRNMNIALPDQYGYKGYKVRDEIIRSQPKVILKTPKFKQPSKQKKKRRVRS